ncbi:MAG: hypothetical protein ACPF84_00650, partial [Flavobacteriales bacterium]
MVVTFMAFLREDFAFKNIELRLVLLRQKEPKEADDDEPLQSKRLLRAAIVVIVVMIISTGTATPSFTVLAATVHIGVRLIRCLDLFSIV